MSEAVIAYDRGMSRWEPHTRDRLERAALELYRDNGFERTTVAEIARQAGLTERTFFRHFADKREVLFSGASSLQDLMTSTVARQAAAPAAPMDAVAGALDAAGRRLQERGDLAQQRQDVIAANPVLQERELIKLASLAAAMAATLRSSGVGEPAASLCAEAGIAVFRVAFERWVQDTDQDFPAIIEDSLAQLRVVAGATPL
jgi:AcrR family transcriptional regulator